MHFRRILLPLDRSETTEASLRYGVELASAEKAELWLLHVDDESRGMRFEPWTWPAGSRMVPAAGLPLARRVVLPGTPAVTIAEYADEIDADLILMPTRGRGALRQLLLGSTTMDVLNRTRRPVWVIHQRRLMAEPAFRYPRIVCGVKLGAPGRMVIQYAAGLAAKAAAELVIVHVIPVISEAMLALYGLDEKGEIELVPDTARKRIVPLTSGVNVPWTIQVMTGNVADSLRQAAKKCRADLVVIGRGRDAQEPVAGANVGGIIARSMCPVITFSEALPGPAATRHGTAHHEVRAAAFAALAAAGHPSRS